MNFQLRLIYWFLFFLLLGGYPFRAASQTNAVPTDSVKTLPVKKKKRAFSSDKILENLKQLSKRKTIVGRGLDALFDFDAKHQAAAALNPELISNGYEKHNYKVVRKITFKRLNSFGYSITDTTKVPRNFVEKAGNYVHARTQRARIRNNVLFKNGEPLEPLDLSESERLLRQTEYILDARVLVNENTSTEDSVDIIVITKDVFSLSGSAAFNTKGFGRMQLNDINFLGLGHQFRNKYEFGIDSVNRTWNYAGSYTMENISNSYISAQFIYRDEIQSAQKGVNLYRDFYTINTKYAGALSVNWFMTPIYFRNSEDNRQRLNLNFSRQDFWLGKAYKLKSYNLGYDSRARLITAGRVMATQYYNSPNADYQNNILYLGSFGYSFRKYYRDQYLFGFGRTEDIPAGSLISFTTGYEKGALYNRYYAGGKISFGKYSTDFGYLYFDAQYDGYIRNKRWEQAELSNEILYFTKLLSVGTWQWRHFIWNRSSWGINRKYGENILNINRQEGVRGFGGPERGTRKFVLNYESSLFTPIFFLGFRLALVNFADIAWLSDGNKSNPFHTKPYQAYGIGFRFRNEYMAFNTIQVLLGYYPQGSSPLKTYNSTRPYYDFNDLKFSQPIISDFR